MRQADINFGYFSSIKNKTEDFTLISLNKDLEPTYLKLKIPDEDFVSLTMNRGGDFFLITIRNKKNLEVRRYERGSIEPSEPITLICADLDKLDLFDALGNSVPSEADRNIVYFSIAQTNQSDDREIVTAKFNFTTHQSQTYKRSVYSVLAEEFFSTLNNVTNYYGYGLIITCYNSDLKLLFQQVMPVRYSLQNRPLTTGYSFGKKIVSKADPLTAYGQLDLFTGKWLKLTPLSDDDGNPDEHIKQRIC